MITINQPFKNAGLVFLLFFVNMSSTILLNYNLPLPYFGYMPAPWGLLCILAHFQWCAWSLYQIFLALLEVRLAVYQSQHFSQIQICKIEIHLKLILTWYVTILSRFILIKWTLMLMNFTLLSTPDDFTCHEDFKVFLKT